MSKNFDFISFDPLSIPEIKARTFGQGSIGGKAKGLILAQEILKREKKLEIKIPESYFLSTECYDVFREKNKLWSLQNEGYYEIKSKFIQSSFPQEIEDKLRELLRKINYPLAIRSSSLLEDNLRYSFAGKYLTVFIPNQGSLELRMNQLSRAIKQVYASVFDSTAVEYRKKRGLKKEKMAIIIQRLAGQQRGALFYPEIAGVGFSKNYRRWTNRIKKEDGVIRIVFGLGTRCTGRNYACTFSLSNTNLQPYWNNPQEISKYSQEVFDCLDMVDGELKSFNINNNEFIIKFHPNFGQFTQIYKEREIRDFPLTTSLSYPLDKIIFTFKGFSKYYQNFFKTLDYLFHLFERETGSSVDIEFTYETTNDSLNIVQVRPLTSYEEFQVVRIPSNIRERDILLKGDRMLTNGILEDIKFLVYVDHQEYFRCIDKYEVARTIGRINKKLEGENYILVGPGRWGTNNPQLGVPVRYNEISNCGLLVELGISYENFTPELSYGTHFFSDLEVDNILYLPVFDNIKTNIFNKQWFESEYEKTEHLAVRIFPGKFNAYLDGENLVGLIVISK